MQKQFLAMAAVLALSAGSAYATSSVCVGEDGTNDLGEPVCTVTCCDEILALDPNNPPEPPAGPPEPPADPASAICGSVTVGDASGDQSVIIAGRINPNGSPPSDPADPTTQNVIEGCIAVGPGNTSDVIGTGNNCREDAVQACVDGNCAHSETVDGTCDDALGGGGGGGAPGLPGGPGDLPAPPADLPL